MSVVTQRQRTGEVVWKLRKATKVIQPPLVIEGVETDAGSPVRVAITELMLGEIGRRNFVEKFVA
jgi:hypothetical protein